MLLNIDTVPSISLGSEVLINDSSRFLLAPPYTVLVAASGWPVTSLGDCDVNWKAEEDATCGICCSEPNTGRVEAAPWIPLAAAAATAAVWTMLMGLLQLKGYFGEGMGGAKAKGIGGGDCHINLGEDW